MKNVHKQSFFNICNRPKLNRELLCQYET